MKHSMLVPYFVSNLLSREDICLLQYAKKGKQVVKGQIVIIDFTQLTFMEYLGTCGLFKFYNSEN